MTQDVHGALLPWPELGAIKGAISRGRMIWGAFTSCFAQDCPGRSDPADGGLPREWNYLGGVWTSSDVQAGFRGMWIFASLLGDGGHKREVSVSEGRLSMVWNMDWLG